MVIKKFKDSETWKIDKCHDGEGSLVCRDLLRGFDSNGFRSMHWDELPKGCSIGYHTHDGEDEEIYFLVSGKAILTYDGEEYEMNSGDIHLCTKGHCHAIKALEDCILIVVGDKNED